MQSRVPDVTGTSCEVLPFRRLSLHTDFEIHTRALLNVKSLHCAYEPQLSTSAIRLDACGHFHPPCRHGPRGLHLHCQYHACSRLYYPRVYSRGYLRWVRQRCGRRAMAACCAQCFDIMHKARCASVWSSFHRTHDRKAG